MFEEIKGLQQKELEILKELKRVCDKNNIGYFLAFGTLIGAIRHQGFIPWDDDIDVSMNYDDYCKFIEVCRYDLKDEFFLQTIDNEPESGLTYLKLRMNTTTLILDKTVDKDINQGINIDIYPVYHVPDNGLLRKIQLLSVAVYMLFCEQRVPENHGKVMTFISRLLLCALRGKARHAIRDLCHKYMAKYEGKETKYKAQFYGNLDRCRRIYPAYYFDKTTGRLFVDEYFPVQVEYDKYLTQRYGDYMKLPPKEEQGVKLDHIIKIDTDVPYIEYKGKLYCTEK